MPNTSGFSQGEWHKCRRFWQKGFDCPFHPLPRNPEDPEDDPDDKPTAPTPSREPTKQPPRSIPDDISTPVPVPARRPTNRPGPRDPGGGRGVPDPVRVPIPVFPPPLLPPGIPLPPFDRPPAVPVPVPVGVPTDTPGRLPDGAPILSRDLSSGRIGTTGLNGNDRTIDFEEPEGDEPLTPSYATQLAISVIRLYNQEFGPKGDLFLPPLPTGLASKTDFGDASSNQALSSIYQDALTQSETAYVESLTTLPLRSPQENTTMESPFEKSQGLTPSQISAAIAAAAATSAIGLKAFSVFQGGPGMRGGRGGFTAPSAVTRLQQAIP